MSDVAETDPNHLPEPSNPTYRLVPQMHTGQEMHRWDAWGRVEHDGSRKVRPPSVRDRPADQIAAYTASRKCGVHGSGTGKVCKVPHARLGHAATAATNCSSLVTWTSGGETISQHRQCHLQHGRFCSKTCTHQGSMHTPCILRRASLESAFWLTRARRQACSCSQSTTLAREHAVFPLHNVRLSTTTRRLRLLIRTASLGSLRSALHPLFNRGRASLLRSFAREENVSVLDTIEPITTTSPCQRTTDRLPIFPIAPSDRSVLCISDPACHRAQVTQMSV